MWFKTDNKRIKALEDEMILLKRAFNEVENAFLKLETNTNSLRGLVNRKLGKGDLEKSDTTAQERQFMDEFLLGIPHIAQAAGAEAAHAKSLTMQDTSAFDGQP